MLHTISENIAVFFFNKDDKYPLDIYVYGIELMISSLIGTILVLTLGILFGHVIESIIFMLSLSLIRVFSGGYHAETYLKCNSIFVLSAIFVFLFHRYYLNYLMQYNILITAITLLISVAIMIIFAPVENKNKTIEDEKKRKFKVISILFVFIEIAMSLVLYYQFGFSQGLIILPTVAVVDISILAEIILKVRRKKNESSKEHNEKDS